MPGKQAQKPGRDRGRPSRGKKMAKSNAKELVGVKATVVAEVTENGVRVGSRSGWLSDRQLRDFNVADVGTAAAVEEGSCGSLPTAAMSKRLGPIAGATTVTNALPRSSPYPSSTARAAQIRTWGVRPGRL